MSDASRASGDPLRRGSPPGSLRYFSVLFAPTEKRPLLDALYAFEGELRDTVDSASHEVAHTRLQWWRAEIDRYAAGRAQHPVTVALASLRDCASHDAGLFHELLTAADLDLARMTYANARELDAYAFRAGGALQTLVAAALAGPQPLSEAERLFARNLGLGLRHVEMLRDLLPDARRGLLHAPLDALQSAGIEPLAVATAEPAALRKLMDPWRERAAGLLAQLPAGLTAQQRVTQRAGLVLGALHQRLLSRIDPSRPAPQARAEVPPWSRLWTAWTTAVRYG